MTSAVSEPVRVTHCIGSMRRGGSERQLAELIARLPAERFRQSLVLLQGGGDLLDRIASTSCEVVELRYSMRYRRFDPRFFFAMGRALWIFIRHLRRFRPHVLHGWLFWANILSVVAGRFARVPVILTSRRQLGLFKDEAPQRQPLENFFNRFTTLVVANSEAVRKDALERENLKPEKVHVIHNGVEEVSVDPAERENARAEFGIGKDDIAALVLANFHPYKGHADALKALRNLHADHPELLLLFAGRDQGTESRLRERVRSHGLEDRVRFLGERRDVPRVLAAADLLIHPSEQEGFPNAILEAMAAGLPVVAYDLAACREAIVDGETGRLAPSGDVGALTLQVRALLEDSDQRQRMGEAGAARMRREFSMDQMVGQMASLYETLAETKISEAV